MTRDQALEAMRQGEVVRRLGMSDGEYIYMDENGLIRLGNSNYVFELDGVLRDRWFYSTALADGWVIA